MSTFPTINPPQIESPEGLVKLRSLIQAQPYQQSILQEQAKQAPLETRTKELQNQDAEYQIAQRNAINKAWKDAITNDPMTGAPKLDEGKLMTAIGTAGYGSAGQAVAEHLATYHKSLGEAQKLQQEIEANNRDSAGALGYSLQKAGYDPSLGGALLDQQINNPNLDPQHRAVFSQMRDALSKIQDPEQAKALIKQIADPLVAQSEKYSKIQSEDITAQSRQLTATTGAERLKAEMPGGVLQPVDKAEMADFIKNPPKGYKGTPQDFARWKASLSPTISFNLAAKAGGGLTDAATDQAAEIYHLTGRLPAGSRGRDTLAQNRKIMNRAAELYPGSMAADSAEYAANKESLRKLQAQFDAVTAFESTAEKNINRLLQTMKNIPDLGTRFANVPLRMVSERMIGAESMARFRADLITAQNEAAKVLNSANAQGVLSDSARAELQEIANGNLPNKSLAAAFEEITNDMHNRKQAYSEQIKDIQKRLPAGGGGGNAPGGSSQPLEITLPSGKKIKIG
jgi:hypothetical protein